MRRALVLGLLISLIPFAWGEMVITEWMYNGAGTGSTGEFIEFTNTGATAVDMTGWSYDDDSRTPGTVSLSAFGVVVAGESVILTDETAETFAAIWGLSDVKIIGGNTTNIGRNDEINLYNASGVLVDRLTYGDETYAGTVRTQTKSCNIPPADYGYTVVQTTWVLASDGDAYGSKVSTRGEVGSPGRIVGYAPSDFDRDGDVDVADLDMLACCMTGPDVAYDPLPSACTMTPNSAGFLTADYDRDDDIDLADFAVFQQCYTGEGNAPDFSCGRAEGEVGGGQIILNGDSITVIGGGVTVNGTTATIRSAGTYSITGTLTDGQIVVNTPDPNAVEMVLNAINIRNSTTAPISILSASRTYIVLADQTTNYLTDPNTYVFADPNNDEPSGTLFSKDPVTISGTGTLVIDANYNDGIACKDDLTIVNGTINVTSVDDGIRGKDSLFIENGNITATTVGDALKSDNEDDPNLGYITIQGGTFNITSGGDGIAAETDVSITDGNFTIVAGGGRTAILPTDLSAKGIKGLVSVTIGGGTFNLNCADDGVHSDNAVTISGGTLNIAVADHVPTTTADSDAIHADSTILISGGTINITESYEGIEAPITTINNGTIHIVSSDDGINCAQGTTNHLYINGGYAYVNANGDGIDVNGSIDMTGGTVIVCGPTGDMNAAIDFDVSFKITGGFLLAAGSAGMAQAPSTSSTQRSVKITFNNTKSANTIVRVQKGISPNPVTDIFTFSPVKQYRSVVFSAPTLVSGSTYYIFTGGTCTGGTVYDGLYTGGTYTPGTQGSNFNPTNIVTNVNSN